MNRTSTRKLAQLILAATLTLSALALGAPRASASIYDCCYQSYTYTFDSTVAPWKGAMYREGVPVEIPGKQRPVLSLGGDAKNGYALLSNNGADALWMQATFKASASNVAFNFDVMGIENADRLAPIVYIGKEAPTSAYQFQKMGYPLAKGQQTLYRQIDLAAAGLVGQEFVIAVGFMNLDGVQKAQRAAVDNIQVRIHDGD